MHKQTIFPLLTTILVVSTGCSKQAIQLGMQQGELKRAIATDRPTASEHLDSEHDMEIESWIDRLIKDDLLKICTDNYIYIELPPWLTVQQIKTLITYLCKVKSVDRLQVRLVDRLQVRPKEVDVPQMLSAVISALEGSSVSDLSLIEHDFSNTRIAPDLLHKAFALLQNTKVEYLDLCNCWLGDNIYALLTALKGTSVRNIDLSCSELDEIGEKMLSKAFSALKDTKIEELDLTNNFLSTKVLDVFPALQGTSIRCLHLTGNLLSKIEPSQLSEAFSLFQGTNVEVLDLEEFLDEDSFKDWSLDSIRAFLFKLSATKVQKIRLSSFENLPQWLIDEFNIKVAYPHDTVYHDNGLKRACMRAMLQNVANPERVGAFELLPEKLKQEMRIYKKDEHPELGLQIID